MSNQNTRLTLCVKLDRETPKQITYVLEDVIEWKDEGWGSNKLKIVDFWITVIH